MDDDWGTVNLKSGRSPFRDIDLIRRRYADHRSTMERLAADAPTEHLARRYRELIGELDASLDKILELQRGVVTRDAEIPEPPPDDEPVVPEPGLHRSWDQFESAEPPPPSAQRHLRESSGLRGGVILAVGVAVLAILGYMVFQFAFGEAESTRAGETTVEEPLSSEPVAPVEPVVEERAPLLLVTPQSHDYGSLRRGARAARQFEVTNRSDRTVPIEVRRSDCRCLWFEYADTIPAKGTTTLTVTIDGSKAPPGTLRESVEVVAQDDGSSVATAEVIAEIRSGS